MIRISLMTAAALVAIAAASPAFAQAGAPVRTLHTDGSTVSISERKAPPCADKSCASKPLKRAYVAAAPLGW